MTKTPTTTKKSKKQHDNTKTRTKNIDYTTNADRLGTGIWGNNNHPTGVVKPIYRLPTVPSKATAV